MTITVYSKPGCAYCMAAKQWLDRFEIPHRIVDVTQDPAALAFIKERGHRTVPQLYLGERLLVEGGFNGLTGLGIDGVRQRLLEAV